MTPTDRLLAIVVALQEAPWQRAADLAARLNVSPRTIYRDVEALAEAGVPVVGVPGKGYRLHEAYFLPALPLTTDEAVLLMLATADVDRRLGTKHQAAAASVRAKLDGLVPDRLRTEAAALERSLRLDPVNVFDEPAERLALDRLHRAWAARRVVRFRDGGGAERTVHPYGLVHLGGAWHLLGFAPEAGRVESFRIDGLGDLDVLDETFERPPAYDARPAAPAEAEREIRVVFDADVTAWVQQAPSAFVEAMEETPEGLAVTLRVARLAEVLPWLLSWGAHARVVAPESLRRRLAREAEQMAARYASAPSLLS